METFQLPARASYRLQNLYILFSEFSNRELLKLFVLILYSQERHCIGLYVTVELEFFQFSEVQRGSQVSNIGVIDKKFLTVLEMINEGFIEFGFIEQL